MRHPRLLLLLLLGLVALTACAPSGTTAEPRGGGTSAPAAPEGTRWVSFGDVIVAVPQEWGYAESPGPAWCAGDPERFPREPYVAVPSLYRAIPAIGCPSPFPPEEHRAPSVELGPAAPPGVDPAPLQQPDGDWVVVRRALGATVVSVTVPTDQKPQAETILASMRQVATDHLGCPVSSPVQQGPSARPEPAELDADDGPIVVCQYASGDGPYGAPGSPGLIASVELPDDVATSWIAALADAPEAPEPRLADCPPTTGGALVIRVGEAEVYGFPFSCGSAGWIDTGDRRVALTPQNCAPLFATPVAFSAADGTVYGLCRT